MQNSSLILHRWAYWLIILVLSLTGGVFYYVQNSGYGIGGSIALPKLFWLAYALWFWYFLPLLIATDERIGEDLRKVYWLFWLNMFLRAVAELWMMYFTKNWHPYWGISHDIFSAILVVGLLFKTKASNDLDATVQLNLQVIAGMFLIEACFAWYMLSYVKSDSSQVYFVPGTNEHLGMMVVTWFVVLSLTVQQFMFGKKWLGG